MTKPPIGPRTRQRRAELQIRLAMLASGRTKNLTVEAVRAATALNERDRAERLKGGRGDARLRTARQRLATYRQQNPPFARLTVAQARNIRRRAARTDLVLLVAAGAVTTAELRTYPITEDERAEWLAEVDA